MSQVVNSKGPNSLAPLNSPEILLTQLSRQRRVYILLFLTIYCHSLRFFLRLLCIDIGVVHIK